MRGPYGFEPNESCQSCKLRATGFFCQLSAAAIKDFNAVKSSATYPAGAVLFLEKQDPRGVFVLCGGEVKLSISSSSGKTLILRIAKAGEILGLMATMSGQPLRGHRRDAASVPGGVHSSRRLPAFRRQTPGSIPRRGASNSPRSTAGPVSNCGQSVCRLPRPKNWPACSSTGPPKQKIRSKGCRSRCR